MSDWEYQYLSLMGDILNNGEVRSNRTGVDTHAVYGRAMQFDLAEGFPLLTTKKIHFKGVAHELLWFLRGDTNIKYLVDNGVNIWNDDAYKYYCEQRPEGSVLTKDDFISTIKNYPPQCLGDLGRVYGAQWRRWAVPPPDARQHVDQIERLVDGLKNDPDSRRHILQSWNPGELDLTALPACHVMSMYAVVNGRLNCNFVMRSNDFFLGAPYNIASYALLTHMLAQVCGLEVGVLSYWGWDVHLYDNHLESARKQIGRPLLSPPKLELNSSVTCIDDFKYSDIKLVDYNSHPAIKVDLVT